MTLSPRDQKLLWGRARNLCSFGGCRQQLTEDQVDATTGEAFATVVGEQAHIRSASRDGPRYDPDYPVEKLETYENRILLCPAHHGLVDDQRGRGFTADDLLARKRRHEKQEARREQLAAAVQAYLVDRFDADDRVRFRQVRLDGPTVDSMFVDVPFGCRDTDLPAGFLRDVAATHPGDAAPPDGFVVTGAAQALLHPGWTGHALLVAGPGQGKSTLLQYLCQFHRGRRLERDSYTGDAQGLRPMTDVARVAIRLDLRDYAAWAAPAAPPKKGKKPGRPARPGREPDWPSLEEYIAHDIDRRSGGHPFDVADVSTLLATEPVLLALDGLDEVADLDHRRRVGDEVLRTTTRLTADACNLVVVVATRPGLSTSALWSTSMFPTFYLQRLSAGLRLQYLQRWCQVAGLAPETATKLQNTFAQHENLPHIRDLASYPMQLAILLHLLHQRGLLPQQRTELYTEFLKTFLDREETEEKEPLVSTDRGVIEDVHAALGWYLQLQAEDPRGDGRVSRTELKGLLRNHLRGQEKGQRLAQRLFDAIEGRVLCLIEREPGYFEFEVQSLREYFAARYVNDYAPTKGAGNSRDDCFDELLVRPYWSNVCRFYVGMFTKMEVRSIGQGLRQLATRPELTLHPLLRAAAARLLEDRAFQGQQDATIQAVVDFILAGPGVVLAGDGFLDDSGQPLTLPEDAGRSQVVQHLERRLADPTLPDGARRAAVRMLASHNGRREDLDRWCWDQFQPTEPWLRTAAELGALTVTPGGKTALLRQAVTGAETDTCWPVELLAEQGYRGQDDQVLQACAAQLNDGAADLVELHPDTPLGKLVDAALDAQLRPNPAAVGDRRGVRTRHRPARGHTVLAHYLNRSESIRARLPPTAGARAWLDRLHFVHALWGDGWVLRQAAALTPATVDLTTPDPAAPPDLARVVHEEAARRVHRSDPDWWLQNWEAAVTPMDRRCWLFSILTVARTRVVLELAAEIDAAAAELAPRHFRSLEVAVAVYSRTSLHQPRHLHDPLRRGLVRYQARSLWLLRATTTPAGVQQIDKKLADGFPDLLTPGMGDRRPVIQTLDTTIRPDQLAGTRDTLPAGWRGSTARIRALTAATANQILADPGHWPAELVGAAIQHASGRLARLPDIAHLVATQNWFQAPDGLDDPPLEATGPSRS